MKQHLLLSDRSDVTYIMEPLINILILGRPNVGKSTLFNRLVGRRMAIVHDEPGVTRDWRQATGHLAGLSFNVFDTAGLEGFEDPVLKEQIARQTEQLIHRADVVLFLVDAREGVMASERKLAQQIRQIEKPVVLMANKCEGREGRTNLYDFYALGLGEPLPFSAEHGEGINDLYEILQPLCTARAAPDTSVDTRTLTGEKDQETEEETKGPLRLAIVGRPNVGKSTLTNAFLREERVLTGDRPGLTRDAVTISWSFNGQEIQLIDTAGLRRRSRIEETLEKSAAHSSIVEIRYAHVVIMVLDAQDPLNHQDLTIAAHVIEEGRALVIALNKWDEADHKILPDLLDKLSKSLPQIKDVPIIPISALRKHNLTKLMIATLEMNTLWRRRIPTAPLNQWLQEAIERHPPPLSGKTRVRLKYITQIKSRPPTFALFVSKPVDLPDSYLRYLVNSMRECLNMPGVPIRLLMRKGKNPYVKSY